MHGQVQSRHGSVLVPIDDVENESNGVLSRENSQIDLEQKKIDANNNRINKTNAIESAKVTKEKMSLFQRICSKGTRKASDDGNIAEDNGKRCNIETKDDAI